MAAEENTAEPIVDSVVVVDEAEGTGLFVLFGGYATSSIELSSDTSGTSGNAYSFLDRIFRAIEDSEKGRLLAEWRGCRGWEKSETVERMAVVISSRDVYGKQTLRTALLPSSSISTINQRRTY